MVYLEELIKAYRKKKVAIKERLKDFREIWQKSDKKIFAELCYCILTPQSKAGACNEIVCRLEKSQLLFKGGINEIRPHLKNARFYKNKSRYLLEARRLFSHNGKIAIKDKLGIQDIMKTREWLAKNVKGIGYKEASHFLRNIGFGDELAILDVHILRNLKKLGLIRGIPKTLTRKRYFEIENKLRYFSDKIKIPMAHLDLLFWSAATNKIFK